MPSDLAPFDVIAFVWFVVSWVGFTIIQDHLLRDRQGVNQHLKIVRRHWMEQMLQRENRIMDSQLFGHTMHSCTFFASTNMLVLAGLVGSFGAIEHAHDLVSGLSFTAKTSRQIFECKLLLMVGIFTFGFFKFTWALRQYNYCCALIGSAPAAPVPHDAMKVMAEAIGDALTLAVTSLNGGMRSYYFALAVLAWVVGPLSFMLATTGVIVVLTRRQAFSATEKVIRIQTDRLEQSALKKQQGVD